MAPESFQLVSDNVVMREDGSIALVESMFSGVCDLAADRGEVLARLHPAKTKFFDMVSSGAELQVQLQSAKGPATDARFHRNIEIHVNHPRGGIVVIDYASLAKAPNRVIGEARGKGFDANAEPILRQMQDRSFRLVFCSMPPRGHRLGAAFDMDHFGAALMKSCKADIKWDDRDVFYISKSATASDIREVLGFMAGYSGRR